MAGRAIVFYDGECRFCVASVATLRALDWLGRLELADARDPSILAAHREVDREAALARLQLLRPGGGPPLDGFLALRWLAGRLPALWPLWPLLWLPGVRPLGIRAYDAVARNRFALGGCHGACGPPDGPGDDQPVISKSP